MSEGQTAPNLKVLEDGYEILGELRSGDRVGTYIAKRREDGADVIITVVQAPKGGENNALNHFAADTQLLSQISHSHIPQVIEGRWVGKDQFAVVSQRYQTATLDELLARGEKYTPPRISLVLSEVDSVLEWARSNGVVHRGITPDTLSFETGTNRVLVTLEPTPIPIEGIPDASADARTIGTLAWAMLTGERYADGQVLSDLRPGLAKRVTEDTEAMVRSTSGAQTPDVPTYLAVVAAADALRAGEMEISEMQAELLEARRSELEKFEAEQHAWALKNEELEKQLADERKAFEQKMAEEEAELASVKAQFADLKSKEEGQLAAERTQFEHERMELERERTEFEKTVADREAELVAKQADVDRIRAEEGKRIDAAIAAAVQTVAETAAAVPPPPPPPTASSVETADADEVGEEWKKGVASTPPPFVRPEPEPWISETVKKHSVGTGQVAVVAEPATGGRPRWLIPASIAALIAALVGGYAATHRTGPVSNNVVVGKTTVVPTAPTADVRNTPRGGFLTQTAGGTVGAPAGPPVSPTASAVVPAAPVAGAAVSNASADSAAKAAAAKAKPKPKPETRRATTDSSVSGGGFSAEAAAIRRAEAARRDSIARRDSSARRDTSSASTSRPPDTLTVARRR